MNAAETALRTGWMARHAISGEMATLKPREQSIRVIINREVEETPQVGRLEYEESAMSDIEILREDVTSIDEEGAEETLMPNPGQWFEDGYGYRHEVQLLKPRGWFFLCRCKVT